MVDDGLQVHLPLGELNRLHLDALLRLQHLGLGLQTAAQHNMNAHQTQISWLSPRQYTNSRARKHVNLPLVGGEGELLPEFLHDVSLHGQLSVKFLLDVARYAFLMQQVRDVFTVIHVAAQHFIKLNGVL